MADDIPNHVYCGCSAASAAAAAEASGATSASQPFDILCDAPQRAASLLAFARFATGVIHEVNNPLGIALLSAQLARRNLPAGSPLQVTAALDRVIYGVRMAAEAVRTMLQVCRESDAESTANAAIDVRDVLRFTSLVMQDVGRRQGCQVSWLLSPESSPVRANPLDLEIALASLVYEAIDAAATVVEMRSKVEGNSIEIAVIDNGESSRAIHREDVDPETASGDRELIAEIIGNQAGILFQSSNEWGGTTAVIRLPRYHEEGIEV
jgi:signal transduction histidine kinase